MTTTLNGHVLHLDYSTPLTLEYVTECNALDLETLNIAAPIGPQLLAEFYAAHPYRDDAGTVYPLTTGDKDTDNRLFISRAEFHLQAWQRSGK